MAPLRTPVVLPDVTDAHRRAAFEAMHWTGWTFEAALADDTRRRVVEARAHQMRTQEWKQSKRTLFATVWIGCDFASKPDLTVYWRPPQGHSSGTIDLKRAAAGDFDD